MDDIKKNLKTKKLVLGTDRSIKLLKTKKLSKIFLSSNLPSSIEKDINYYAKLNETVVEKLKLPNDELGVYCKRPHPVSVIGLLK